MRSILLFGALAFAAGGLCAQSFTNNTPQAIANASPNHTPIVAAISVNGLPNSLETWISQRFAWIDDSLDLYNTSFPVVPNLNDTSICAGDSLAYGLSHAYSYDWDPGPKGQVLVPTESGFYTLTVTDTSGCFSRKTVHVEARKPNVHLNLQLVDGNHEILALVVE